MAIRFIGGQSAICLGGVFNSPSPGADAWANPFKGATAMTLGVWCKPDSPFAGGPNIMHLGTSPGYTSVFDVVHLGGGAVRVSVFDETASNLVRTGDSALGAFVAGQYNRIMVRWQADPELLTLRINGVNWPLTLSGTPLSSLSNRADNLFGALEIGANSSTDGTQIIGEYAEICLFSAYKSDADADTYTNGGSANLLNTAGRIDYVTGRTIVDERFDANPGNFHHAKMSGEWTGTQYGATLHTYNYGGGNFLYPSQGVFDIGSGYFTQVTHPPVTETPAESTPPSWYADPQRLPQRGFQTWEMLGDPGPRTGTVIRVPEDQATIQAAMNAAVPGDDVSVAITGTHAVTNDTYLALSGKTVGPTTPRCPPSGNVPVTGSVPVTGDIPVSGDVPVTGLDTDPAYIHVYARDYATNLPGIAPRRIDLPDGTFTIVYDAPDGTSCRVYNDLHASVMATVDGCGIGSGLNIATGFKPHHWMFRGLRFTKPASYANVILGDLELADRQYGQPENTPNHILMNQCVWDPDPGKTGDSSAALCRWDGTFIGIINSDAASFYYSGGGDNYVLLTSASAWGPLHFENNHFPVCFEQGWFSGGGGISSVGVQMQDNVFRRNWQYNPPEWAISEINPLDNPHTWQGWTVRVAANLTTVQYLTGPSLFGRRGITAYSPYTRCTMWEPSTGYARSITTGEPDEGTEFLTLDAAWPGGAGDFTVYFQRPAPALLYNSGCDGTAANFAGTAPMATVANGSTAVTFSAALPYQVQVGHFFYLNNLHWEGGGDNGDTLRLLPTAAGHSPTDNGYNLWTGVTYANCRRKKITAIAENRLSCTLENAYIVLPGEPTTFPFSVVGNDGLLRLAHLRGKGAWEIKFGGSRTLWEGNVEEIVQGGGNILTIAQPVTPSRYDAEQPGNWVGGQTSPYTFTCHNDIVTISPDPGSSTAPTNGRFGVTFFGDFCNFRDTFNPRGWPSNGAEVKWPYAAVSDYNYIATGNVGSYGEGRIVKRIIDSAHVELEPVRGLNASAFTEVSTPRLYMPVAQEIPWITNHGFTHRYNVILDEVGGANVQFVNSSQGEITKGRWANYHDNVTFFGGSFAIALRLAQGSATGAYGTHEISHGEVAGDNSFIRYAHNSLLHIRTSYSGQPRAVWQLEGGGGTRAHDQLLTDNLVVFGPGPIVPFGSAYGAVLNPTTAGPEPSNLWDLPYSVARNIFVGASAATDVAHPKFGPLFPENAGVPDPAGAGLTGYPTQTDMATRFSIGDVDPLDFSPYALAPVYATGTVSIHPDGVTVLKESGLFPTTVVAGQYFRTTSTSELRRITATAGGLSATWNSNYFFAAAKWILQADGTVAPSTANVEAIMTHNTALSDNQWAEVEITGAGPGIALRWTVPDTWGRFGYFASFGPTTTIYMLTTSSSVVVATGALSFVDGDRCRFQASGTTLTASIVGKGGSVSGTDAVFSTGRVGLLTLGSPTSVRLDNFTAGNMTAPSTAVIDDPIGGPFLSFTLDGTPHPEAGQTGLSYTIGFQGSATDGGNPGADYALVEQMVRNVRRVSVFVPPAPDTEDPTITITTNSGAAFGVGTATTAISGTATDNVGVTAITWATDQGHTGATAVVGTPTAPTWTIASLPLESGDNVLTVTARDAAGNTGTDTITVTYTPDTTDPVCTITTNSGADFGVTTTPLTLAGTASDAVGVTSVTWANDRGGTGTATGTTTWSAAGITLLSGANVITVTAHDAAGNTGTDAITVTYTPDTVTTLPVIQTWPGADAASTLTGVLPAVLYFGSGAWKVRNHAAELENAGSAAEGGRIDLDLDTDDYLVTATMDELAVGGLLEIGPCARMQGDTSLTFYTAVLTIPLVGTPVISIQRFTGAAQLQLGPAVAVTPHAGMTVGIWPVGSRLRALMDNSTIIDVVDPSPIATGGFMGLRGVANVNNRVRVSQLAATVDTGVVLPPTDTTFPTVRAAIVTRPLATVRPKVTV